MASFLVIRAYRLARAVLRISRYSTAEEQLILVRSLYETYCKLVYVLANERNARHMLAIDFGLLAGSHELVTVNGQIKRGKIRDKKTGETFDRYVRFADFVAPSTVKADAELFDLLYEYLSSFVHAGSRHVGRMWKEGSGFELIDSDEGSDVFVRLLTHTISAMIMQRLLRWRSASPVSRRDMRFFCRVVRILNRDLIGMTLRSNEPAYRELLRALRARSNALPK